MPGTKDKNQLFNGPPAFFIRAGGHNTEKREKYETIKELSINFLIMNFE